MAERNNDSSPWWKTERLEEGTTLVYLKFPRCEGDKEDNNLVPLSVSKLEKLCKELPIFAALLFGHPMMAPKQCTNHDGFPIFPMPSSVAVSEYPEGTKLTQVFYGLVDYLLLGMDHTHRNLHSEIILMADQLGGSDGMDVFKMQRREDAPKTPGDDTKETYDWVVVSKPKSCFSPGDKWFTENQIKVQKKGFSFVKLNFEEGKWEQIFRRDKNAAKNKKKRKRASVNDDSE
ncbi:expressed unknown protein [Seminavis robusta]|uniref:Uncharacterized protein n=1 Tax=Seminavis robusta TaxID=568900 RepID=A0A9N8F166_9STRA|nr:expressed unknown protein [Seminavis robusta]|eukprot:Sro2528_g330340.1 n/a (232) ;mRNA; r:4653-5348